LFKFKPSTSVGGRGKRYQGGGDVKGNCRHGDVNIQRERLSSPLGTGRKSDKTGKQKNTAIVTVTRGGARAGLS